MVATKPRIGRISQGVALRPIDRLALSFLAMQDSHDSISAAVRKLIDQRMRSEIGSDWEQVVREQNADTTE